MVYTAQVPSRRTGLVILAALLLCSGICAAAQQTGPPLPSVQPGISDETTWEAQQQKEMAKKLNLQRQEEIKKDAEKLLELATELKQSVNRTNENMLSLDVIKKADQIEKLAKSVKDKMKGP